MLRLLACQMLREKYSRPRSSFPNPGWRFLPRKPASQASSRLMTWPSRRSSFRREIHLRPLSSVPA
jgi:hypothetical protein